MNNEKEHVNFIFPYPCLWVGKKRSEIIIRIKDNVSKKRYIY